MSGLELAMTVFFTSDTHFGHTGILRYSRRPFRHADEMDEALIANWNARVKPGDLVYHLGDFALCRPERAIQIARRLQGQKYLVFGNHDKRLRKERAFLDQWVWARDLESIKVGDQRIVLCHYAMRVWNQSHHGAWQLYGHSHGTMPDNPRALQLDVGVDCWNYAPVSFDEIAEKMKRKHYEPVDHHGRGDEDE